MSTGPTLRAVDILEIASSRLVVMRSFKDVADEEIGDLLDILTRCRDQIDAEAREAEKVRAELAILRKELSDRGIDIEARGGRWEWKPA